MPGIVFRFMVLIFFVIALNVLLSFFQLLLKRFFGQFQCIYLQFFILSFGTLICKSKWILGGVEGAYNGQTQIDIIVWQKLEIISYNIYRTIYILDDVLLFIHFFFEIKLIWHCQTVWHLILASHVWHHTYGELCVWNIICWDSYPL